MYARVLVCLLALCLLHLIAADCEIVKTSEGNINLNDLIDANNGKGFSVTKDGWKYSVRLCKNFDTTPSCITESVSAYQEPLQGTMCHYMGKMDAQTTVAAADPLNPGKGVTIRYRNGDSAFDTQRTTQIDVLCDPNDSLEFGCVGDCEEPSGNVRNYHFVLKAKAGCPSSSSGGFLWPVGLLGIFLILSIFGFALYWPIGIIVNKFIRKKEGIEIVPNVAFWKDLPFLVRDGFLFLFKDLIYEKVIAVIVEKIRSRRAGYESA